MPAISVGIFPVTVLATRGVMVGWLFACIGCVGWAMASGLVIAGDGRSIRISRYQ
ncbi:MAG: hypothetical protein SWY16_18290 [Cyanobacteriota bacterium]|nr:hypothetical protein [Cyanobacteriota bacterium]